MVDDHHEESPVPELPEEEAKGLDRRKFLTASAMALAGTVYVGAMAYPVYRYLADPAERAEELAAIKEVTIPRADIPLAGTALMFRFGASPTMLIHLKDGKLVCFSAVCTHLGCTVQYQPEEQRIYCACHGGKYDMETGKNVGGPPPKPLKAYSVEESDEQVVIRRT